MQRRRQTRRREAELRPPPTPSPLPPHPGRLASLDGLRGVLALFVVLMHLWQAVRYSPWSELSQIAVAVFFTLSGLVLTRAYDGRYLRFLWRRFWRLWPVYAVTLAAGYALARARPNPYQFLFLAIPNYAIYPINLPAWSLWVEAWAAPAMPAIAWSGGGGPLRTLIALLVLIALGHFYPPVLMGLFFVLGAYLNRYSPRLPGLEGGVAQFLGRISYSLYLSHWLVIKACVMALGPIGVLPAAVVIVPIGWLVWRTVEQPSLALIRRL